MRTLAANQPFNDYSPQRRTRASHATVSQKSWLAAGSADSPTLQRQCACGGGCPRCQEEATLQPKFKISEPNDRYEQEADRIADEVMQMPEPSVQRQMEPEDEEEEIQTQAIAPSALVEPKGQAARQAPEIVPEALHSPGEPLDFHTRTFMESRLGRDFSQVRVHTDAKAIAAAQAVNAYAFTLGENIVFGTNQYAPGTDRGQRLLAHELVHVVQQSQDTQPVLRRMVRGSGTPPSDWSRPNGGNFTLTVVPDDEVERVDAAIARIGEVATDPNQYSACHDFFQQRCPNATPNILQQVFNNAQIWKLTDPSGEELARGDSPGPNIAYTQSGYRGGEQELAATLMHELGHNCGIPGDQTHYRAEMAAAYCMGRGRNQFSVQFAFNNQTFMWLMTYRRILAELGAGHFRLTAGGDWNYIGTVFEVSNAISPSSSTTPYELGSAMVGVEGRTSLGGRLGAERFGGLFGRVETGFGAGRFLIRAPRPDETTDIYGSYVLQLTGGVEFLIPINPHVFPLSIEAGYRLTQPLTPEAERIHTFVLSPTFHF